MILLLNTCVLILFWSLQKSINNELHFKIKEYILNIYASCMLN
jgi:hypothetical protein